MNNRDYTGKTIFVGIDVHKKTYAVTVVHENEVVKRDTIQAIPARLVSYLQKYFSGAGIKSAYEAGFSGFVLHRHLQKNGIDNIVVNPASIEIGARDRVKNDTRDSAKIAFQLSTGRLRGIYIPSIEMEDRRELTRLRSTFVEDRNRLATRIKHKANYYGLIGPSDTHRVCKSWLSALMENKMEKGLRYALEALIEQWNGLSEKIKEVDARLKEQSVEDQHVTEIYRSAAGIGPTAARVLANELGDMSQFSSENGLFSYTGLTPCEYSSGEHTRRGHISRQGKPMLRSILVQCSWIAIRYDEVLRRVYEGISKRSGAKRAIVAIARRLIGKIRACFRKKESYKRELAEVK